MKNFRAADKSHAGGDEKHDINFHWPYKGEMTSYNLRNTSSILFVYRNDGLII